MLASSSPLQATPNPRTPSASTSPVPGTWRIRTPRTPEGEIPVWFADAHESDGYDSEALELIEGLHPAPPAPSMDHTVIPTSAVALQPPPPSEEWVPEDWPAEVALLKEQWNPRKWQFPRVSIGSRGGAGCGCEERCSATTCLNARESRFCCDRNCAFGGMCGNALSESPSLAIARSSRTGMRGLVATASILAGEVLGQYLGHLQLFGPPGRNGTVNDGYRMHLKTRTSGNKHMGIDAMEYGSKLRLMNHACDPTARFYEVQTGSVLTVVAVSVRDIACGEEVTVSYGNRLWFVCRCGWTGCQHRDIQHLPDVPHSVARC
ncbi:hypothetical protein PR003_g8960 [Phytophthora rubi]|uniref:SET domain-containing protein n=1 Tax=Phytophthora rubi TaxID=129364 RepID=A0A6A4F9P5_9STRA|nr:hypothetical protein PR001_g22241 [Phytophthora rubi]KAE9343507.1 hypothetical protein PR003_g8960 [Phytophthora rubi]